jgi:protein-disulfide isomerase
MSNLSIPVNERDHVIGMPDAPVTVVEYGDYESLDCREMHQAIEKIIHPLFRKVRLVYRHFPQTYLHPHALRAAEAAEAASAQGKFWEMHTLLSWNPDSLRDDDLHRYAKEIGVDLERFDYEMAKGLHVRKILKDRDLSRGAGISSAPTFFVNDRLWAMSGLDLVHAVKAIAERSAAA